jgi:hypothetical protein
MYNCVYVFIYGYIYSSDSRIKPLSDYPSGPFTSSSSLNGKECICICMYVCMYIWMYNCVYIFIYGYIYSSDSRIKPLSDYPSGPFTSSSSLNGKECMCIYICIVYVLIQLKINILRNCIFLIFPTG